MGGAHGQGLLPEPELGPPPKDCPGPLCSDPSAGKSGHPQAPEGGSSQPGKPDATVTMTTTHQPQDRYKAVWLIFFMLGLGTLLPWNFFMTATRYFTNRLDESQNMSLVTAELSKDIQPSATPTVPSPERNLLSAVFNNVMTLCAMLPLLFFTCLNSFLHQRIPQSVRILGSLVAILLVFLITAVLVKVQLDAIPFFVITMVKIVLINSFGAILQGSLFGLAGLLPTSYTAPIMSGQGLAGIFASVAMICAIASGSELSESAFGYFIIACGVIVLAIICYLALPRLEFYRYYQQFKLEGPGEQETKLDLISKGEETGANKEESKVPAPSSQPTNKGHSIRAILRNTRTWVPFLQILVPALSVCFIFTVTIGVFPAVTAEVQSSIAGTSTWGDYFIPVSCFLTFNVFDWLGRSLTAVFTWPGKDSHWLPSLVLARMLFVPLLLLCNVQPRRHLAVVFEHDAWFIIFMAAFAFSNGYLASLCMCFGPKKVKPAEAETAGAIMAFFLSLGLALGAVFSFLCRSIV
ncbi:equilibrative nucleoside transporter 1 isoform X6 [Mirounga angustirostris]|uniref:equilibrative nucleoside transporter 1 isoform X6 n=1 Tax=Mirounga angustirostris TaxID=9716 RepID=UPI00313D4E11